jgi:SAM-dependent methyltransferase
MVSYEHDAVFGDDYLYFHAQLLDGAHADRETADIVRLLDLGPGALVLDVPCGHGRITNRLADTGVLAIGLDITAPFLRLGADDAGRRAVPARFTRADMRALPFAGTFDAVICWNGSFGYFDDVDNRRILGEFHRVLRPGGRLLIETMQHDSFVRHFTIAPDALILEVGADLMIDTCNFDVLTGRIEVERTVVRDGETRRSQHFVRVPTVNEWATWLADAGFAHTEFSERSGAPLTLESWTQVLRAVA